jgi:DNA-binding transcriptional MocR family regulator
LYLQRGDWVLVEDPVYFGALDAFRAVGARVSGLPVEADGVRPAVLRHRITATAARLVYLTPAFHNPTGAVMPREACVEVARIAAELGVAVIDDRTLADLAPEGSPPPPIADHIPGSTILSIGSLSKLVGPGLRIGWLRGPEPVIERLARLKIATDLGSPPLTQTIAARVLRALPEACKLRRLELRSRRDLLAALLREYLPAWKFRVPDGGPFLMGKPSNRGCARVRAGRAPPRRRGHCRTYHVTFGCSRCVSSAAVHRRSQDSARRYPPSRRRLGRLSGRPTLGLAKPTSCFGLALV